MNKISRHYPRAITRASLCDDRWTAARRGRPIGALVATYDVDTIREECARSHAFNVAMAEEIDAEAKALATLVFKKEVAK